MFLSSGAFSFGRSRLRRRRDMPDPNSIPLFRCSSCFALYQVVKTQAGPETVDPQIACRVCNGPLAAREGQFVLKYFLLREASRLDARRARQGFLRAKPTAPTLGFLPSGASNRQMQLSFVQGCGSGMAGRQ